MAKGEFCCSENVIHEGAVAEVREKMHSGEALDTVAGFFKVLGAVSYTHLRAHET